MSEASAYKVLQGVAGIPKLIWVGNEGGYNVMVMELLGPSLDSLMRMCEKHLSLPTVLMLAEQMVFFHTICAIDRPR